MKPITHISADAQGDSNPGKQSPIADTQAPAAPALATAYLGIDPVRLYSTEEIARITGLTVECFEAWRSRGENAGPRFLRLGRRAIRYAGSDLIAWLAASRSPANTGGGTGGSV